MDTDWFVYRQSSLDLLSGLNPMNTPFNYLPPWAAVVISPFAVLPALIGHALGILSMLILVIVTVKQLHGNLDIVTILLISTSPFLLHNVLWGNLEWLPLLGMLLPTTWGLIFVTVKPQSGIGPLLYHVVQFLRGKESFRTWIPFGVVVILAFALYQYPFSMGKPPADIVASASLAPFPWGVPFGIFGLWWAVKHEDVWLAYAVSPLLAPYFTLHTLIGPFVVIATRDKRWGMAAWILGWVLVSMVQGRI